MLSDVYVFGRLFSADQHYELFPIMTGNVLYITLLITWLLAKTQKITYNLLTIYLLPAFVVLISREVVRQRRRHRLATDYVGVDKFPDYLQSSDKET